MEPLAFTETPPYVFVGAVFLWLASDLSIGLRFRDAAERDADRDRGSKAVIGLGTGVGVLSAALVPVVVSVPRLPLPILAFWTGIGLIVCGVALRQYAVYTLGESFSLEVSVDDVDRVVTTGPYRWVRHPSYTGALASLVGVGLAAGNWVSLAVVVVAGFLAYGYRIRVEERALRDELGGAYETYAERTPYRLLPGIW